MRFGLADFQSTEFSGATAIVWLGGGFALNLFISSANGSERALHRDPLSERRSSPIGAQALFEDWPLGGQVLAMPSGRRGAGSSARTRPGTYCLVSNRVAFGFGRVRGRPTEMPVHVALGNLQDHRLHRGPSSPGGGHLAEPMACNNRQASRCPQSLPWRSRA